MIGELSEGAEGDSFGTGWSAERWRRRLLPHAGHVQFANPPGRNEPGVGDADFGDSARGDGAIPAALACSGMAIGMVFG